VALRAAGVSHLLLAHLIALPAQAQIAAVDKLQQLPLKSPGPENLALISPKRGYTIFKFIRLNSNYKGQSSNFK
jgi:hypothetical protein